MDFTAIDFETASHRRDSACQLAAVVVRGGEIVASESWLIRPVPLYFSASNIRIHGITPERVAGEPAFGECWPEIASRLGDDCLVAHNAGFDIGVLLACLRAHRQTIPELGFACTRAIARRVWPGRRGYGLKPLSDWLGTRFRHHDALEDSIACAKILLAAGIAKDARDVASLESACGLSRGRAGPWGYQGPAARGGRPSRGGRAGRGGTADRGAGGRSAASMVAETTPPVPRRGNEIPPSGGGANPKTIAPARPVLDIRRLSLRAEFIRPLAGRRVTLAGDFSQISREFAERLVALAGGACLAGPADASVLVLDEARLLRMIVDLPAGASGERIDR